MLGHYIDPRRSLVSAIGWLVFTLSISLVLVAGMWVDSLVRTNLLDLRGQELEAAAGDIADELNLSFSLRLQSVRVLAVLLATEMHDANQPSLKTSIGNLRHASPEFERIVLADRRGRVLAATQSEIGETSVIDSSWFAFGLQESKTGDVSVAPKATKTSPDAPEDATGRFIDLVTRVIDADGNTAGVIGIKLNQHWLLELTRSHKEKLLNASGTDVLLVNADGTIMVGDASARDKHWVSRITSADFTTRIPAFNATGAIIESPSHIEHLADGRRYVVASATSGTSDALHALGWHVVLLQPFEDATLAARMLQHQIRAVLLGLGFLAALLGVLLARRLTHGLDAITRSADAVRSGTIDKIVVPFGRNEVARLGSALDEAFTSLQRERNALQALTSELEQRVSERTREIERLADQERHAAVARERLKIARDLHDTLAHSMMAMLTEIRLLKRLWTINPEALAEELVSAEETAQQGLKDARAAITQLRFNPVRDAGLSVALGDFVRTFVERSGIPVNYTSDVQAGTFADERAETLFRIAEEAMRNIERHARATSISVTLFSSGDGHGLRLTVCDDGIGFDVEAPHPGHYGLAGLREQANLIGATLTIHSTAQQGTTINVELVPARRFW